MVAERAEPSECCVCACGCECGCLKELKPVKISKTLLSARTEWAEPLHQRSPGQSVLTFTLELFISPQGCWLTFFLNFSHLSLFAGTSSHSSWAVCLKLCKLQVYKHMVLFQEAFELHTFETGVAITLGTFHVTVRKIYRLLCVVQLILNDSGKCWASFSCDSSQVPLKGERWNISN